MENTSSQNVEKSDFLRMQKRIDFLSNSGFGAMDSDTGRPNQVRATLQCIPFFGWVVPANAVWGGRVLRRAGNIPRAQPTIRARIAARENIPRAQQQRSAHWFGCLIRENAVETIPPV